MEITGKIDAPVLAKLAAMVAAILRQDATLRETQSNNAPRASLMGNGTGITFDGTNATLTASAIVKIPEAQQQETFYQVQVFFPTSAGSARYTLNGVVPTAGGNGIPIPSGGYTLTITGSDNIKNFQMICETGQTALFVYQLYK